MREACTNADSASSDCRFCRCLGSKSDELFGFLLVVKLFVFGADETINLLLAIRPMITMETGQL